MKRLKNDTPVTSQEEGSTPKCTVLFGSALKFFLINVCAHTVRNGLALSATVPCAFLGVRPPLLAPLFMNRDVTTRRRGAKLLLLLLPPLLLPLESPPLAAIACGVLGKGSLLRKACIFRSRSSHSACTAYRSKKRGD